MRIQVVNPNTTRGMTAAVTRAAEAAAGGRFELRCSQPADGPLSIETAADTIAASPHVVAEVVAGVAEGCAGHVIACFDDPAVAACREVASGPVVGIAEGSMLAASVLGIRYGVVTTARAGIPMIEDMAVRYGLDRKLQSVRSCEMAVLELDGSPASNARVLTAAQQVLDDGAEVVVLGCAGMAQSAVWLESELRAPVVEGVAATVGLVYGMAAAGLRTSKLGAYAHPEGVAVR
ncbi:aspartate/glutamate racemase family protein [Microbacterium sp.]|uniref:aspartate/glutamate racemase family protein n=1 Tax=Microbacterium sp. TaxID=51671 RepID=UPI0028127494|nr:aspartate/glutamate racemase family protein [Microbacterium sp.]